MAENDRYTGGRGYPLGPINNPYVDEKSWYNYDNAPPTGIQYPGGNPAYPRNEGIYQAPFNPAQGNIPYAPEEKRGFNLSNITGPISGGLQWLGDKFKRPEAKQTAYDAITGSLDDRGYGTYKGNQYRFGESPSGLKVYSEVNPFGKNFDSAFGSKSLEEMDQKTLDWAMKRVNAGKAISSRLRNILTNRGMLGDTRRVTADAPEFITRRDTGAPVTTGGGGQKGFILRWVGNCLETSYGTVDTLS